MPTALPEEYAAMPWQSVHTNHLKCTQFLPLQDKKYKIWKGSYEHYNYNTPDRLSGRLTKSSFFCLVASLIVSTWFSTMHKRLPV